MPYQARLLAKYQRSRSEVLVVSGGRESGWGQGWGQAPPHSWLRPLQAYLCTATSPWRIRPRRSKLGTPGPSLSTLR